IVTAAIGQVKLSAPQRDFDSSKTTIVILVGRSIRKSVVIRSLLRRGANGSGNIVSVIKGLSAGIGRDLVHGRSFADLSHSELIVLVLHDRDGDRVVDWTTGAGKCYTPTRSYAGGS